MRSSTKAGLQNPPPCPQCFSTLMIMGAEKAAVIGLFVVPLLVLLQQFRMMHSKLAAACCGKKLLSDSCAPMAGSWPTFAVRCITTSLCAPHYPVTFVCISADSTTWLEALTEFVWQQRSKLAPKKCSPCTKNSIPTSTQTAVLLFTSFGDGSCLQASITFRAGHGLASGPSTRARILHPTPGLVRLIHVPCAWHVMQILA